jgi:hypothetical protein
MDWLTFFSTGIKSLAWPVAGIIALFVLKRPLSDLLGGLGSRLVTAKGVGFEFIFGERVDQIVESLSGETKEITPPVDAEQLELISGLSKLPPKYIVIQAWGRLRGAIYQTVDKMVADLGGSFVAKEGIISYLSLARTHGLLSDEEMMPIQELQNLRQQLEKTNSVTITDALRYHNIAESLIQKMEERRSAKNSLGI